MLPFYKAFIKFFEKLIGINGPLQITEFDNYIIRINTRLKTISIRKKDRVFYNCLVFYYDSYQVDLDTNEHQSIFKIMHKLYHGKEQAFIS